MVFGGGVCHYSDVKWIYYPAQNVCLPHVLAFASHGEKRSNLDLNFNLTGKTLGKLRWKAHEELADVIEFNSDMIRISNGLPTRDNNLPSIHLFE